MTLIKKWLPVCILLVFLLGMGAAVAETPDTAQTPAFAWRDGQWRITCIDINPDRIVGNPAPDTDAYYMIRFCSDDSFVAIYDLIEGLESFSLADEAGEIYPVRAYMPYAITFSERNGVFATAAEQATFELLFIIPRDVPAESLSLQLDEEPVCAFGDETLAAVVQGAP